MSTIYPYEHTKYGPCRILNKGKDFWYTIELEKPQQGLEVLTVHLTSLKERPKQVDLLAARTHAAECGQRFGRYLRETHVQGDQYDDRIMKAAAALFPDDPGAQDNFIDQAHTVEMS